MHDYNQYDILLTYDRNFTVTLADVIQKEYNGSVYSQDNKIHFVQLKPGVSCVFIFQFGTPPQNDHHWPLSAEVQ